MSVDVSERMQNELQPGAVPFTFNTDVGSNRGKQSKYKPWLFWGHAIFGTSEICQNSKMAAMLMPMAL